MGSASGYGLVLVEFKSTLFSDTVLVLTIFIQVKCMIYINTMLR